MNTHGLESMVELLRLRAERHPGLPAYVFLENGEEEGNRVTFDGLHLRSCQIAVLLRRSLAPGERALLIFPPGLEFIAAYFGCLYAGVVAVPAYPPHPVRPSRTLPRLRSIARDAGVRAILSTQKVIQNVASCLGTTPELSSVPLVATDQASADNAREWRHPKVGLESVAFLQYTSGSTSSPKGVMVSHGNLLHNLQAMHSRAMSDEPCVTVSWLPAYHDMGLIGAILQPLFGGYPAYLMSPLSFLQRPVRWLQAVSRFRATNSGGPNFAYDLCIRKTTPDQRKNLDLSSWRIAYNGSEPVRTDTMNRFVEVFREHGFQPTAFKPVYGLAEATLMVSGGSDDEPAECSTAIEVDTAGMPTTRLSCGSPLERTTIVIVDPEQNTLAEPGEVGEIWLSSPSVAMGYWNRPELSAKTFGAYLSDTGAGPFLRTGDLGYLMDGELYVTGRIKDVIIVRGRKHYPQDLEYTVESSHPAIRENSAAAISLDSDEGDRVMICAEVNRRRSDRASVHVTESNHTGLRDFAEVIGTIRDAVAERHELQVYAVSLLPLGALPKTSSGKKQRNECRAGILAGTLETLAQWLQPHSIKTPQLVAR